MVKIDQGNDISSRMKRQASRIIRTGQVSPADSLTRKLIPFDVPISTTSVQVKYTYSGRAEGNAIDLGLFAVNESFRGFSGGSKTEVVVANDRATPGYIPGLIEPGEWYVLLGVYNIVKDGTYEVEIVLDDEPFPVFQPCPAPSRTDFFRCLTHPPGYVPKPKWLKGDFHMHTIYSDGHFTLDELVEKAQKRGLNFIFSTEHNTFSANMTWGKHVTENLLIGRGIEVTSHGGHWNAIGLLPEQYIDPLIHDKSDPDASLVQAVREVHKVDGFGIINHPFAECKCCSWTYSFHQDMDAIEVWNGPWRRYPEDRSNELAVAKWDELLREGKVFTATGGSDIHEDKFEIAEPCTRVLAEETSVNAIIGALRRRHCYMVRHPEYELEFTLDRTGESAGVGDWLEGSEGVRAKVRLRGIPACETRIITDQGIRHRSTEKAMDVPVYGRYVRVEVRSDEGDMLGMTNPIWIAPNSRQS